MAWVSFMLMSQYRRRMEENIALTLGKDIPGEAERKDLVWRAWKNFARGVLDTMAILHHSKARIVGSIRLDGEEHLQSALAKGKGVLALSAHLGSFTLIGARLAAAGYPFSVVVKHPADERFARLTDDYRSRIGIHTIPAKPRRQAVRGMLKALRENRIVLVIADEFKSGDVMVDFFGMQVAGAARPGDPGPAHRRRHLADVRDPRAATIHCYCRWALPSPRLKVKISKRAWWRPRRSTRAISKRRFAAIPISGTGSDYPSAKCKFSRAELALRRKERIKKAAARDAAVTRKTGTRPLAANYNFESNPGFRMPLFSLVSK